MQIKVLYNLGRIVDINLAHLTGNHFEEILKRILFNEGLLILIEFCF